MIIGVIRSLDPGSPPFLPGKSTVEAASGTAVKPKLAPPEGDGAGEIQQLVEDAKKTSKRLMGTDPDDPTVLQKILSVGSKGRAGGPAKLPLGLSRALGGAASLFIMHMIDPPTLGNACSDADAHGHKCVAQ